MSYDGHMSVRFFRPPVAARLVTGTEMLQQLLKSGWAPGNGNAEGAIGVRWFEKDQTGELRTASFTSEELFKALELVRRLDGERKTFTFDLNWAGDATPIRFTRNAQKGVIEIGIGPEVHAVPGLEPLTDHTWYVTRILPPLQQIGCDVEVLEWWEGP